jgi:hypothetical protein
MLKQLPIKKEYLLLAASVLLLIISYQFAFKRTLNAWQLHNRLNKQLSQSVNMQDQPSYLERKAHNLDQIIDLYKTDTTIFRSNTISAIASIAEKENVKLSEVPIQDPVYNNNTFVVQKLDFDGDYFALTKMLSDLQSAKGLGVPRSAAFKSVRAKANEEDSKKLILEVFLETVK